MSAPAPSGTSASILSEWLAESPSLVSDEIAVSRAKDAVMDTIACILAGVNDLVSMRVFSAVRLSGAGGCTVFGHSKTLSSESAALANGVAAHALDFDDNFNPGVTHASAVLVPALLAMGEETEASGLQVLDAYIAGLEVEAWLGRQMIPAHYSAGWHATSTIGAIGAAGACARILKLDAEHTRWALSIATSMAGGSKIQFGTMVKPLHVGLAARAGISAARLAAAGVEGINEPFSGNWGFVKLHHGSSSGKEGMDRAALPELAIISAGLAQKKFPCCASAHRTMDAIIQLMLDHRVNATDIDQIETVIPDYDCQNLRYDRPANEMEARFSMHYCASVVALYGRMGLADFTKESVCRKQVRDWLHRVSMYSMDAEGPEESDIWEVPAVTNIILHNGDRLQKEIIQPVGTIYNPMSDREKVEKFYDCARRCLSQPKAEELFNLLSNVEKVKVRDITVMTRSGAGSELYR